MKAIDLIISVIVIGLPQFERCSVYLRLRCLWQRLSCLSILLCIPYQMHLFQRPKPFKKSNLNIFRWSIHVKIPEKIYHNFFNFIVIYFTNKRTSNRLISVYNFRHSADRLKNCLFSVPTNWQTDTNQLSERSISALLNLWINRN